MTTIKNLPTYARNYRYIVARPVDGDIWFFGAWNEMEKAREVAVSEDCLVYDHHEVYGDDERA